MSILQALGTIVTGIEGRLPPDTDDPHFAALDRAAGAIEQFCVEHGTPSGQGTIDFPAPDTPPINTGTEVEDAKRAAKRFLQYHEFLQRDVARFPTASADQKAAIIEQLKGHQGATTLRTLRNHLYALALSRSTVDPSGGGIPAPSYNIIESLKEIHEKLDAILARLILG